jgi:hypothetical protein
MPPHFGLQLTDASAPPPSSELPSNTHAPTEVSQWNPAAHGGVHWIGNEAGPHAVQTKAANRPSEASVRRMGPW